MGNPVRDEADQLLVELREIVDAVRVDYRRRERLSGLPIALWRALAVIAANPGVESSAVAAALGVERSTASNLLRELEERGLVERQRLRSDRRYVSLAPTPRGETLLARAGRAGQGLLARSLGHLAEGELLALRLALAPLLGALRSAAAARERAP